MRAESFLPTIGEGQGSFKMLKRLAGNNSMTPEQATAKIKTMAARNAMPALDFENALCKINAMLNLRRRSPASFVVRPASISGAAGAGDHAAAGLRGGEDSAGDGSATATLKSRKRKREATPGGREGGQPTYRIEAIAAKVTVDETTLYSVKWQGYPSSENAWETSSRLKEDGMEEEIRIFQESGEQVRFFQETVVAKRLSPIRSRAQFSALRKGDIVDVQWGKRFWAAV